MPTIEDVIAAKDELSLRLLRARRPAPAVAIAVGRAVRDARRIAGRNLHAIGVGRKLVDGKRTSELCVRLYVLKKVAAGALPRAARLPGRVFGVPTDVIESPLASFHAPSCTASRRRRLQPIMGGISAAHAAVGFAATLGCFCRSKLPGETAKQFILGCSHSFANLGSAAPGSPILQPAAADAGGSAAGGVRVARLVRSAPIVLGFGGANRVDAAIAVVGNRVARPVICSIGTLTGITAATEGMIVRKHGRTTGYTEGQIVDISMDAFVVDYVGGLQAIFVNQYRIEPTIGYAAPADEVAYDGAFAAPGDSGSVVVEVGTRRAVALHFAGAYGISVSNPIAAVCNALKVSIP